VSPAERPVRHFVPPRTLGGRVRFMRFTLARRAVQFFVLLLFFGTAHWSWTIGGQPLLEGNFSAAKLAGALPLADPFAMLQTLVSGHLLAAEAWIGAALTLVAWIALGGRAFCAWACPLNVVTDAAAWCRARFGAADLLRASERTRYALLLLALVVSAIAGVAAFEWVSPIGMLHRAIVFGSTAGLVAVAGVFLFDLAALRNGWCGHLCPLGAFWSIAGRAGVVKVRFDAASCTRCGDCVKACPEPQVLNFARATVRACVDDGACTNCGRCVAVCPEQSLSFGVRPFGRRPFPVQPPEGSTP
jgi:ferredoxin-type protein NapH